jgi:hypothetical protein
VRRLNRSTMPLAFIAAAAIATMTAGCSSGATASSTPPPVQVASSGHKDGQAILKCLADHGVPKSRLRQLYFGSLTASTGVSPATLKAAGEECWSASGTGLLASAFRRIDNCLGVEGIRTAHTGSPLADVLLELDAHSQKARNALQFCLRT